MACKAWILGHHASINLTIAEWEKLYEMQSGVYFYHKFTFSMQKACFVGLDFWECITKEAQEVRVIFKNANTDQ